MRHSRRWLGLMVLFCLFFASPHAKSQTPSLAGYPAVGAPATVSLLSPGAEPRTRLRYRIAADHKAALTMTMEMSMLPTMQLPAITLTANVGVTGVAPAGDIAYDLAFTGMTAETGPGMDPSVVAMMQAASSEIVAVKGVAVVSDRGLARSTKVDMDSVTDPSLRQTLASLSSSIENLVLPLPEEPIGVGARWEIRQAVRVNDAHTFQRTECELVSMEAGRATVRLAIEQTAPPQPVTNPMLPPGLKSEILKLTGSGSGSRAIRLDSLVSPGESTTSVSALMRLLLPGKPQDVTVDTKVKVTVAPGTGK
jgi:hypothetical protein